GEGDGGVRRHARVAVHRGGPRPFGGERRGGGRRPDGLTRPRAHAPCEPPGAHTGPPGDRRGAGPGQSPKSSSSTGPCTPGRAANREPAAGSSPSVRFSRLVVMNRVPRSSPPKAQAVTCVAPTEIR